jgi:hypothetical protein
VSRATPGLSLKSTSKEPIAAQALCKEQAFIRRGRDDRSRRVCLRQMVTIRRKFSGSCMVPILAGANAGEEPDQYGEVSA